VAGLHPKKEKVNFRKRLEDAYQEKRMIYEKRRREEKIIDRRKKGHLRRR